jgi:hypothetical protein
MYTKEDENWSRVANLTTAREGAACGKVVKDGVTGK